MTTAIALARSDVPESVPEMMQVARFLGESTMLPEHLRGEPASLFAVMLKARALNIPMATAFDNVIVQDGKTGLTTTLMQALVIRAGYKLFLAYQDDQSATVRAEREGIGPNQEGHALVSFSLADAERAKLITIDAAGKITARSKAGYSKPWELYTQDMLIWRAIARAARYYFGDVLMGMVYTPDELGAEVDGDGQVVRVESVRVDTVSDDVKAVMLRINRAADNDTLRTIYDESAALLSEIVPDGRTVSQYLADKKGELDKAAKAAARAAARTAKNAAEEPAPAPAEQPEEPAPVVEQPDAEQDPPPVVSDPEPGNPESGFDALTPSAPPEEAVADADTEDTPRRKAVIKYAAAHFGHHDTAEEAAVEHFGRPLDTIGTGALSEWLADVRKAGN